MSQVRVRMPGKYIVLAIGAVVSAVVAGTSVIERAGPVFSRNALTTLDSVRVGKKTYVQLPDFLVDLSPDRQGRVAYLKLSASLVFEGQNDEQALQRFSELEPYISERATFFLRALKPEDFRGTERMNLVKAELLERINAVLGPSAAEEVVIGALVIQ